jgi:hypothetical protein
MTHSHPKGEVNAVPNPKEVKEKKGKEVPISTSDAAQ